MSNQFAILDRNGRLIRVDTLADGFAPVLLSGQSAVHTSTGQVSTGTLSAVANGVGVVCSGSITFTVWGTFVATARPEISFDGGTTWVPLADDDGVVVTLTAPGHACARQTELGVLYRVACSAYTSGAISWQIGA